MIFKYSEGDWVILNTGNDNLHIYGPDDPRHQYLQYFYLTERPIQITDRFYDYDAGAEVISAAGVMVLASDVRGFAYAVPNSSRQSGRP